MELTDIKGAAKILKCSVQQIYLLEQRENNPLPVHKPINGLKGFVKVSTGANVSDLIEIPEKLRGGRRPKKVYFVDELKKWLNAQ